MTHLMINCRSFCARYNTTTIIVCLLILSLMSERIIMCWLSLNGFSPINSLAIISCPVICPGIEIRGSKKIEAEIMSVSFFTFILPILFHPFHDRKRWREAEKSWSLCSPRARLILLLLMLQPKHHEQQKKNRTHTYSRTHLNLKKVKMKKYVEELAAQCC